MLVANVILSLFDAPYGLTLWFAPATILLLLIECGLLHLANRNAAGWAWGRGVTVNLISYLLGWYIVPYLFVPQDIEIALEQPVRTSHWNALYASFAQAFVLSIVIEIASAEVLKRYLGVHRVVIPLLVGNVITYALLLVACIVEIGGSVVGG